MGGFWTGAHSRRCVLIFGEDEMGRRGSRLPSPTIQQGNERVGDVAALSAAGGLSKVNSRSSVHYRR
jgi:hypothetical protein